MKPKDTSFISAIANNKTIHLRDKNSNEGKELEEDNAALNSNVEQVSAKVSKSKKVYKHLEFLSSIIDQNELGTEKGYIYVSGRSHERLKKLNAMTNYSLQELADAILNDFFEKNKSQIDALIKKNSSF